MCSICGTSPPPAGFATDGTQAVVRSVAALGWNVIEAYKTFEVFGLPIMPLHVDHGSDYPYMFAFEFGKAPNRFVYMSDVSAIPDRCMQYLTRGQDRIEILVLDSLFRWREHSTHVNLPQALDIVERLRPQRVFFTGMGHEIVHDDTEEYLRSISGPGKRFPDIELHCAYDGLRVPVTLA